MSTPCTQQIVKLKWLENTVGKGEIVRYEQFLLVPQCFQKTCTADTIGQTFCFVNWVQNKGSLSMFSIAPGAFIWRNMVIGSLLVSLH